MDQKDAKFGTVVQVIGPVVDVKFEGGALPEIYTALQITSEGFDVETPIRHRRRGRAAHRRGPGPLRLDAPDGRPVARHEGREPRRADRGPGGRGHPRPGHERHRRARRQHGPDHDREALPHPPPPPGARAAEHQARDVRDGHQGHRPHPAVPQGRQDRPVRRRGRRQDGHHPGAHPQRRAEARRLFGLRRRRRADPRGQRPLARDEGARGSSARPRSSTAR